MVAHDANGRRALAWLKENGIRAVHVSLADKEDHAVAFVTLETA